MSEQQLMTIEKMRRSKKIEERNREKRYMEKLAEEKRFKELMLLEQENN